MGVVVDARFKSSMKDESDPLIMERPTAVRARASSSWMKPAALIVGGTLLAVGAATYVSTPYSTGLMLGQPKTGPVQGPPDGPKGPDERFDIGCADGDARCLYEELCGVNMRVNKGGCMFDAQKRQDILENTLREIKECRDGENHNGDLVIQTLKVLFEEFCAEHEQADVKTCSFVISGFDEFTRMNVRVDKAMKTLKCGNEDSKEAKVHQPGYPAEKSQQHGYPAEEPQQHGYPGEEPQSLGKPWKPKMPNLPNLPNLPNRKPTSEQA